METTHPEHRPQKPQMSPGRLGNQRGIALILALLMSFAIMAMVTGVLYVVSQSTQLSTAGKGYATAEEAADGAINVMKDAVNLTLWGEPVADVLPDVNCVDSAGNDLGYKLDTAILNQNSECTTTMNLGSTVLGGNFSAMVTIERLFSKALPGGRLEFARSAGGLSSTAIFFRISATVTGPNRTRAENSALYRFAG